MTRRIGILLLMSAALLPARYGQAQPPRQDVIWARSTAGAPITLDGVLDEPAWASAETKVIRYRYDAGAPGSGWKDEVASPITGDSTFAEIKFLTVGNQLYMGAVVRDSSVGGGGDFNRFDGFIMSLKDHASLGRPAPTMEYTYTWWAQTIPPGPGPVGGSPYFGGRWATPPWGSPRTQEQVDAWDAVTTVQGTSNTDAAPDDGYTIEMRFDLGVMGYDILQSGGDIVEWNVSVYDCDWRWPGTLPGRISSNRTWWQDPWGNVSWYGQAEIHARPDVTISSGPAPIVGPRTIVPNGHNYPVPTIDGVLDEVVWGFAPHIELRYGDPDLRDSYGDIAKWRSGQYQPMVNEKQAAVLDTGTCVVRYFFTEDTLYFGFDVNDRSVNYASNFTVDRWDGFDVTIDDLSAVNSDHTHISRDLYLIVGPTGQAVAQGYLPYMIETLGGAKAALTLKPGTSVDTTGTSPDVGYTAELAVDLTKLGYPPGRGDGMLFFGVDYLDGDCFTPFTFSYGTRVWWQRERGAICCPASAYMDPLSYVVGIEDPGPGGGGRTAPLANHPNPFRLSTSVRFTLSEPGAVTLEVFDLQGRQVSVRDLGLRQRGPQQAAFTDTSLRPGLYLYRVRTSEPATGRVLSLLTGKMMRIR